MTPPDKISGGEPQTGENQTAKGKNRTPKASTTAAPKMSVKAAAKDKPASKSSEPTPPPRPERSSRDSSAGGAIGVGILVLMAGALGGIFGILWIGGTASDEKFARADPVPAERVSELQSKINKLEGQFTSARERTDMLEGTVSEFRKFDIEGTARLLGEVDERVALLEESVSDIISIKTENGVPVGPVILSDLRTGLSELRKSLSRLEDQVATRVGKLEATAAPANLNQILLDLAPRNDLSLLEKRVVSLEEDQTVSDAKRAALILALTNLSRAVEMGAPFDSELEAVAIWAPNQNGIGTLQQSSTEGLPTRAALLSDFDALIDDVLEAERITKAEGRFAQIWAWLSSFISVRPKGDIEGTDTKAVLARTEFKLNNGNLKAAAVELEQLDGHSAATVASWKRKLDAHIALEDLINSLTTQVLENLGQ